MEAITHSPYQRRSRGDVDAAGALLDPAPAEGAFH